MTDDNNDYEKINFLLIGDLYAGTVLIIDRFINNKCLTNKYQINILQNFYSKKISINKRNFSLTFFIPISSEKFRPITRFYYRMADICIFVFDIKDIYTFNNIKNFWFPCFENDVPNNNFILALVGNESDKSDYEKIDDSEIIDYAKSINAKYFKVSSFTGEGINELFEDLIKTFCELNDKKQNKNKIIKIEKKDMKVKKRNFVNKLINVKNIF